LTSVIENDTGGAFAEPTATNLNTYVFANNNADSDPNLDLASLITETTWYKPGAIVVGDDYLVDVPQDINGSPRVNPPRVGAYEN
ncbi:MAG: hypothetical protein PF508_17685, partial [Spirochaeta sp.]|nr:hypothetical protein [Spirochaeta sp.]